MDSIDPLTDVIGTVSYCFVLWLFFSEAMFVDIFGIRINCLGSWWSHYV